MNLEEKGQNSTHDSRDLGSQSLSVSYFIASPALFNKYLVNLLFGFYATWTGRPDFPLKETPPPILRFLPCWFIDGSHFLDSSSFA